MNTFRILAETISDRKFFDIKEIEQIIESHFKLWLSDISSEKLITDDLDKKRNILLSEKEQLDLKRSVIEKQLFDAKEKIKEGIEVDKYWMSRANLSFRITKSNLVRCQNQLSTISKLQKKKNAEASYSRERYIKANVFKIIKERFGENYTNDLFNDAEKMLKTNHEV